MSFTLTDDEFNDLDAIKGQLGFVNSLLASNQAALIQVSPVAFGDFLTQLEATASRLVDTLLQRHEAARQQNLANAADKPRKRNDGLPPE